MGFLLSIFGLMFGLVLNNFIGAQSQASDVQSKTDINAIYVKLEEHYNETGGYPTLIDVEQNYDMVLPGLDKEALYDEEDAFINEGSYRYEPTDCTALECRQYTLSAKLKDGTTYTKLSLN